MDVSLFCPWDSLGKHTGEECLFVLQKFFLTKELTWSIPDLVFLTHLKRPRCWERLKGMEEKGMAEDEMVGWHHGLDGHEFEQAPGVGDGQGGLACCSPWGRKELDMTEQLN